MEKLEIVETENDVILTLSQVIEQKSQSAISERNKFVVGLSGGSLCDLLCKGLPLVKTEWTKWTFIFCDERVVPFDNIDSTFKIYKERLIPLIPVKEEQFIVINPTLSALDAAEDYELKLRQIYPDTLLPEIDLLLLGAGPDGHTCSLFPGHPLLNEKDKWVASIDDSPKPPPSRVTLTYPIINNATCSIFAMAGAKKAEIIKILLKERQDLPAGKVKSKEVMWIMDKGAASML